MPQIRGIHVPKESNVKNYIINGDMGISQRGTSFPTIASGTYNLDRYYYEKSGGMVHTVTQDTDVPTMAQANYLFKNSLRANLTTPDTSIAAGEYIAILQKIEGYNFSNIAQKTFTLSFWVKATATGIYCVSLRNSTADRSYVAEYTINATNTWEYKTIVIPPSPSAGTWNYTTGVGLHVGFVLAVGSTFQTSANSWQTGNFFGTSNQVNGVNTGATDFRIAGVMLNEGVIAAPFGLFGEDIDGEFAACQRYFQRIDNTTYIGAANIYNDGSNIDCPIQLVAPLRTNALTTTFVGAANTDYAIVSVTTGAAQTGFSFSIVGTGKEAIRLRGAKGGHGLATGSYFNFSTNTGAILVSGEL